MSAATFNMTRDVAEDVARAEAAAERIKQAVAALMPQPIDNPTAAEWQDAYLVADTLTAAAESLEAGLRFALLRHGRRA
jgi:hypothetical protein